MNARPELGFRQSLCTACGHCVSACEKRALSLEEGTGLLRIDRALCNGCGECVQVCPPKALTIYGQKMTAAQVIDEIGKDAPFYRRSGGGVTVSGGEPLRQPKFLRTIMVACRQAGIHTAIETSGYCSSRVMLSVMAEIDLIMLDLKVLDANEHQALTGKRNDLILNNARLIAEAGCSVQPRMPLIPGINDSVDNIDRAAAFLHSMSWQSIELMPYHQFGKSKYEALGKPYTLTHVSTPKQEDIERTCKSFRGHGIECMAST
jgi:pyruvate formate lyase activating enzyme